MPFSLRRYEDDFSKIIFEKEKEKKTFEEAASKQKLIYKNKNLYAKSYGNSTVQKYLSHCHF